MLTSAGFYKRAWIRNPAPIGQPALGHINCPCGGAPETAFHPDTGNVICKCGAIYTWDGWIIKDSNGKPVVGPDPKLPI
jgi:hypothetical protein